MNATASSDEARAPHEEGRRDLPDRVGLAEGLDLHRQTADLFQPLAAPSDRCPQIGLDLQGPLTQRAGGDIEFRRQVLTRPLYGPVSPSRSTSIRSAGSRTAAGYRVGMPHPSKVSHTKPRMVQFCVARCPVVRWAKTTVLSV